MTLFNVSYTNPEVKEEINALVGRPFGFLQRIRMGSIGSQRFLLTEVDDSLRAELPVGERSIFCNIGLRPRGLQIWFPVRLHTYLLALPFKSLKLEIDQAQVILSDHDHKLTLTPAHNAPLNVAFIDKIKALMQASG